MTRDPLGRNGDTVRSLGQVFTELNDQQWQALGRLAFANKTSGEWKPVTRAIADSASSPPLVNALETAGIAAASRVFSLPQEHFGGRYQRSAAREYPGGAMFMVAISDQYPRWITELALRPLADLDIDIEPFLPPAHPDDEPMPEQYHR